MHVLDTDIVTQSPPPHLLQGAALFLDFDGTLVDIADRPDAIVVPQRLRDVLARLAAKMPGRLAIVSGRSAGEIAQYVDISALHVAGSHGMEFVMADGRVEGVERPAALDGLTPQWNALAAQYPGMLVEEKPLGTVLHYRLCPQAEGDATDLARDLAARHGLHLQTGKMMVELRAPGGDKGSAIRRMMAEPAMQGMRPVFLGDDDTDEPGLAVAEELGGAGILIGPARPTAARFGLPDPAEVIDFLEREAAF